MSVLGNRLALEGAVSNADEWVAKTRKESGKETFVEVESLILKDVLGNCLGVQLYISQAQPCPPIHVSSPNPTNALGCA